MADDAGLINEVLAETSFLYGGNAAFVEDLYARWAADPDSVEPSWKAFFASLHDRADEVKAAARKPGWAGKSTPLARPDWLSAIDGLWPAVEAKLEKKVAERAPAASQDAVRAATLDSLRAIMMIRAYRMRGHLRANLDPLGIATTPGDASELDPATYGFTDADWAGRVAEAVRGVVAIPGRLRERVRGRREEPSSRRSRAEKGKAERAERTHSSPSVRRRAPLLVAVAVGAVVIGGGILWPEPERPAVADPLRSAAVEHTGLDATTPPVTAASGDAARTRAAQEANRRGLRNSSMAVQSGEQAVIETATPIAQSDAQLYQNQQLQNQQDRNQTNQFNSNIRTNVGLAGASATQQNTQFNQNLLEQARQFDTTAQLDRDKLKEQGRQFNSEQRYKMSELEMRKTLAQMDADSRESLAQIGRAHV